MQRGRLLSPFSAGVSWSQNSTNYYRGCWHSNKSVLGDHTFFTRSSVFATERFAQGPGLFFATKVKKTQQQFIDEGIYEVIKPGGATKRGASESDKPSKKAPLGKRRKARKEKDKPSPAETQNNEEPKPRITIDVLAMLEEEERAIRGEGSSGKRCHGCGVAMQTTDPTGLGYRPPQPLQVETGGKDAICQRCHFLRYQNKVIPIRIAYSQLKQHLTAIKDLKALVVKIVDIFDFSGSWIDDFRSIIGGNPIVLVANKVDLLPTDVGQESIKEWLRKAVSDMKLKNVRAIHLISAKTGEGVGKFAEKLEKIRKGRDVYVMGCTNVGKSTLINRLLTATKGPKHRLITTSGIPGTTLNLISFPIGGRRKHRRQASLYDTPGVVNDHQMAHHLTPEELKLATPSKRLRPQIYRMVPGKTLFFGGLARIDYVAGPGPLLFTVFLSHQLPVHPTNMAKADTLYEEKAGVIPTLQPPLSKERAAQLPSFILKDIELSCSDTYYEKAVKDIVFGGLGWLSVTGPASQDPIKLRVGSPCGVGIYVREPLMPLEASRKKKNQKALIKKHGKVRKPRPEGERSNAEEEEEEEEEEEQPESAVMEETRQSEAVDSNERKPKDMESLARELFAAGVEEDWEQTRKKGGNDDEEEEEEDEEGDDEDDERDAGKPKKRRKYKGSQWWKKTKKARQEQKKREKAFESISRKAKARVRPSPMDAVTLSQN